MTDTIRALLGRPVFRHFFEICRIPHGSGSEQALSSAIFAWAREQGLEAEQDGAYNVLIRKPAPPGCADAAPVALQAHIDMVCEKAPGVEHDFARDPIRWVVEGDRLSTGGRTTLGADNGAGAAMMLSALEDRTLRHPALECVFTTMEEDDMSGAASFDLSRLRARRLINLDNFREGEIVCGSCGGERVDVEIPVEAALPPEGMEAYTLRVSGLRGGHSGGDIHRGRDSANAILGRVLLALEPYCFLGPIRGGSFRLAIPREAEAEVWAEDGEAVRAAVRTAEAELRRELIADADVKLTLTPARGSGWCVPPGDVVSALALAPDGIDRMSGVFPGTVDTSCNLGEVYLGPEGLHLVLEIRAARDSRREALFRRVARLAALLGGTCRASAVYPGWDYRPESRLRELCGAVYRETLGTEPVYRMIHGGLEVGYFLRGREDMEAVSIGPDCRDYHSPSETLSISSTERVYACLLKILARLCDE